MRVAGGDARNALNALELAVTTTPANRSGEVTVDVFVPEPPVAIGNTVRMGENDGRITFEWQGVSGAPGTGSSGLPGAGERPREAAIERIE